MKFKFLIFLFFFYITTNAQEKSFLDTNLVINEIIEGSLLTPTQTEADVLTILIGDYGPTDRNGNQNFQKNNNLKKLAIALSENGIASFRYDKRIVKQIRKGRVDKKISFDDFVTDAISVIDTFRTKNTYRSIYIIGHGQGSLVGMLAAKDHADGFISLAGSGKSIDQVILEQIELTVPGLVIDAQKVFDVLRNGKTTTDYPPALADMFNIETQAFITSWMQYNPKEIISKIDIPILIINGTKDLQVSIEEANSLKEANENAQIEIIENMNHVLFIIEGDDLENSKSYNEAFRSLAPELMKAISAFIK